MRSDTVLELIDDDCVLVLKDSWDDLLARLREASQSMSPVEFAARVDASLRTLGPNASIRDLVEGLADSGVMQPRSTHRHLTQSQLMQSKNAHDQRYREIQAFALARAEQGLGPWPIDRGYAQIG